jgi:CBS domain-containing protein
MGDRAMKVAQLMMPAPLACGPDANLAEVAALMWDANCGIVPVVDEMGCVVGVVTDRDICIAAATRDLAPSQIRASELPYRAAITCLPEDDVHTALRLMTDNRVRRLPVTNEAGALHGIISIDDIILETGRLRAGLNARDVVNTLQAICAHPLPATLTKRGGRKRPASLGLGAS